MSDRDRSNLPAELQAIVAAAEAGASVEELVPLFLEVKWNEVPEEDQTLFFQATEGNEQVIRAHFETAEETGALKTGAPIVGGIGAARTLRGPQILSTVAKEPGKIALEGARHVAKDPNLAQQVLRFLGRSKLAGRAAKLGVAGGGFAAIASALPEIEGAAPEGEPQVFGTPELEPPEGPGALERALARGTGTAFQTTRAAPSATPEQVSIAEALRVEPGFNVLILDRDGSITGTPGQVAVLTPEDLGGGEVGVSPETLMGIGQTVSFGEGIGGPGAIGLGTDLSGPDLISQGLLQSGGATTGIQLDDRVVQTISPQTTGRIQISAPTQVPPSQPSAPEIARAERVGVPTGVPAGFGGRPIGTTGFVDLPGGPTRVEAEPSQIPAGSQIAPRVFLETRGRTLLEWANVIAKKHDVPLNILYGIIDHESNWLPTAVGDDGNSHGLAQIYMPVWGDQVSVGQARDPVFALEWTARKLAERFDQYGRWDAAIAAHNSPVAADFLAKNNRFQDEKSANYVSDVMSRSNQSGLSDFVFAPDALTDIPVGDEGLPPEFTPFQSPDPAASREFISGVYQELLGRNPTEDELLKGIAKIESLAFQQHGIAEAQFEGVETQALDIEAQFREAIEETGEFAFHEETTQLDSFADFTSGVARLLQQGL